MIKPSDSAFSRGGDELDACEEVVLPDDLGERIYGLIGLSW